MNKKRHHYVPKAYIESFCDSQGKILVYRKDNLRNPFYSSPDNVGFHKYYYSQPLPDGSRDNDTLEDFFSEIESRWPSLVNRLRHRDDINDPDSLRTFFEFMALQRSRVPAARDAVETILAEKVISTARVLDATGMLPPKPPGCEDILDRIEVAINPHESIHAIPGLVGGMSTILETIGLVALHNKTDIPFLTSDNPVIWFDPSIPEAKMQPYVCQPGGQVVLLFPIAPDCIVYGDPSMQMQFASHGFEHSDLSNRQNVKMINRHICRFAYDAVFAQQSGYQELICKYADVSPVLEVLRLPAAQGEALVLWSYVFGSRKKKPKWSD